MTTANHTEACNNFLDTEDGQFAGGYFTHDCAAEARRYAAVLAIKAQSQTCSCAWGLGIIYDQDAPLGRCTGCRLLLPVPQSLEVR